jgi:hypothetical protein
MAPGIIEAMEQASEQLRRSVAKGVLGEEATAKVLILIADSGKGREAGKASKALAAALKADLKAGTGKAGIAYVEALLKNPKVRVVVSTFADFVRAAGKVVAALDKQPLSPEIINQLNARGMAAKRQAEIELAIEARKSATKAEAAAAVTAPVRRPPLNNHEVPHGPSAGEHTGDYAGMVVDSATQATENSTVITKEQERIGRDINNALAGDVGSSPQPVAPVRKVGDPIILPKTVLPTNRPLVPCDYDPEVCSPSDRQRLNHN